MTVFLKKNNMKSCILCHVDCITIDCYGKAVKNFVHQPRACFSQSFVLKRLYILDYKGITTSRVACHYELGMVSISLLSATDQTATTIAL